jgi:hypothetical protein
VSVVLVGALLVLAASQQPPVFRAEVGVVRVEVLVTRGGQTVRGLTAGDFELRDRGICGCWSRSSRSGRPSTPCSRST